MNDMGSLCAIGALAVILCAVFMLKRYLLKVAYGFRKSKKKISDQCANRYPYQAILTIDGITEDGDAERIKNALEGIGGVQAEADVSKRRMIVRMTRAMDDNTIRCAVESLGPYIVYKIERTT